MRGFLLLIPFFIIRFGLLSRLDKNAVRRAAHFPPMEGKWLLNYWIYQLSNSAFFVALCFLTVLADGSWQFYAGLLAYALGLLLCALSVIDFARPSVEGLNVNGLYRFSRNPMYVSYFVLFTGCALLTGSMFLFGIVLVFILSSHGLILAEERWCMEVFGETYERYRRKTRRYI